AAGNIFRPEQADHPDQSRWFSGVYSTYKGVQNQTIDFYWLWLKEDEDHVAQIDGNRHTIGARWEGKQPVKECCEVVGTWLWELEGAYQFGDETFRGGVNADIQAGFVSGVMGYTFNNVPWTPTIKSVVWYGSGDDNPGDGTNNTVNTLFPLGHAYWGIADNLNGQNLLDYSIQTALKPAKKLSLAGQLHWFFKAEATDPIFNVAGAPFPNPAAPGTGSKNIGSELDLIATYQANKNLQLQAGYSWFWYGNAVTQDVISRGDASQFYFMATLDF
ncbi:MAG: alginate export family protein, partial [Planctomycetota bacterium]|nr:alginate export family protein [Planctomycetota bacterium]